ncbi:CheR family methyltransferase [Salinicola lusitanus]|uniref:Chemotaxis protein methyltransferase n=1 Tax=Salinicola lusitanus TaxID=1949085 RepID=A0ABZ3CQX5_9GAMM|nr:CheR family methyltransferase [Salinicola lusitanus]
MFSAPGKGDGGDDGAVRFTRDLDFTPRDFERVRDLIYRRAGIVMAENKREMVYSRLAKRLRLHGMTRFGDYLDRLEARSDSEEWEAFTNALTTNLTAFFREAHHFPTLAEEVRRRGTGIKIWCAGASTGEEPYSLAMTVKETLGAAASQVKILATDIDTEALNTARAGVYSLETVEKLGEARCRQFFQRGSGARAGKARVRPELAAMIDFRPLNLVTGSWSINGPFDIIFCRNVMIYFDKETQAEILRRFAAQLKPDGLLFAGHSENFSFLSQAFRLRGQTVYTLASPSPRTVSDAARSER